ncbi:MAG: hypothetical protein PHC28_05895 [Flavobacterium sp.]|nr:hypothetical protein [Flavobacterium sp.]
MQTAAKYLSEKGAIITGSFALKSLGFFGDNSKRNIHDIDIVFPSIDQFKQFVVNCNEELVIDQTVLQPEEYTDNYYKCSLLNYNFKIDSFIRSNDISTINFDGINYEKPREIVKAKIDILFDRFMNVDDATYNKHREDLHYIFEISRNLVDKDITI